MRHLLTTLLIFCIITLWSLNKEQERIIKNQDKIIEKFRIELTKKDSLYMNILAQKDSIIEDYYQKINEIIKTKNYGN